MANKRNQNSTHDLVLALYPTSGGLNYAVFEGPTDPLDWGRTDTRRLHQSVAKFDELREFYEPDVIVLEERNARHRGRRAQSATDTIARMAIAQGLTVHRISKADVRLFFGQYGATKKYAIARQIAIWLPIFSGRLPRYRKPWMSEDSRMGAFDAVALALTYYYMDT